MLHAGLGPINRLTSGGCFQRGAFGYSRNHLLWSQKLLKWFNYEGDLFFAKCAKCNVNFKNAINIGKNGNGFEDNCIRTCC